MDITKSLLTYRIPIQTLLGILRLILLFLINVPSKDETLYIRTEVSIFVKLSSSDQ